MIRNLRILLSFSLTEKGVFRLVLEVGVGLSISNVIDRMYFNTIDFTRADVLMIIATFLFAIIDYKKR